MIIAQISDSHLTAQHPQRADDLRACVAHINASGLKPDVVIHTGDIAHNASVEEYIQARQIMDQLSAPYYVIPGNRDRREELLGVFSGNKHASIKGGPVAARADDPKSPTKRAERSADGFVQYAVDDFKLHLVFLDTLCLTRNKGEFCPARFAHARELLFERPDRPILILAHHPPFEVTVSPHPFQFISREQAGEFEAMIEQTGNIVGLICGHVHREARVKFGGTDASTMGAVAVDLRFGTYLTEAGGAPCYQVHRYTVETGIKTHSVAAVTG